MSSSSDQQQQQQVTDQSFVTLATSDHYVLGALTLAHSLRQAKTTRMLTVLITNSVSDNLQEQLRSVFDHVIFVNVLNSEDKVNLALLTRPELGVTFTKIHCWRLVQFAKCVFLDADTLVLHNVDELFEREELSAATDVGWPDCFNSGVYVYTPSLDTYQKLLDFAVQEGSFDGGDQGLLNSFFSDWSSVEASRRLPFIYNMTTNISYSYAPAFKKFFDKVKIVHFIGNQKPWYHRFNIDTNTVLPSQGSDVKVDVDMANMWWSVFNTHVLPKLSGEIRERVNTQLVHSNYKTDSTSQKGSSGGSDASHLPGHHSGFTSSFGHGHGGHSGSASGVEVGSEQHQTLWERGHIEYTGRDSFSNIQAHLDKNLEKK